MPNITIAEEKKPLRTDVTADDVLHLLIEADVAAGPDGIVSTPHIAHDFHITRYRARKLIAELKERGLVESTIGSLYSPVWYRNIILRGYVLTEKARHLKKWHETNIGELKRIAEIFSNLGADRGITKLIKEAEEAAERDKHHE